MAYLKISDTKCIKCGSRIEANIGVETQCAECKAARGELNKDDLAELNDLRKALDRKD